MLPVASSYRSFVSISKQVVEVEETQEQTLFLCLLFHMWRSGFDYLAPCFSSLHARRGGNLLDWAFVFRKARLVYGSLIHLIYILDD